MKEEWESLKAAGKCVAPAYTNSLVASAWSYEFSFIWEAGKLGLWAPSAAAGSQARSDPSIPVKSKIQKISIPQSKLQLASFECVVSLMKFNQKKLLVKSGFHINEIWIWYKSQITFHRRAQNNRRMNKWMWTNQLITPTRLRPQTTRGSHRSCECRASPAPDWYQLRNGFCRFAIKNIVLYARFAFYLPAYIVVIVFVISASLSMPEDPD